MIKYIIAIGLAVGLFVLNVILLRANRKTPVPKGCENLTPNCNSCGINDCSMRGTFKGEENNGNR